MSRVLIFLFITYLLAIYIPIEIFAVEYPIISLGFNGGWGQSELAKGAFGRTFLRYSLEAYIPGFQIEVGFAGSFYSALNDSVIFDPEPIVEKRTLKTIIYDRYPAVSATFHLRPFGTSTIIYLCGGAQIHFLSSDRKTTDRYWADEAEKYQQTEIDQATLLEQTKFGYHCLGGLRFVRGGFGSADLEVRKTFLNVSADDWKDKEAGKLWGAKSWNNLSVTVGLTIYIFKKLPDLFEQQRPISSPYDRNRCPQNSYKHSHLMVSLPITSIKNFPPNLNERYIFTTTCRSSSGASK